MNVYFYTLGCKVNQYETQAMSEKLKEAGYSICTDSKEADICVVNSCTVTSSSDQKTRQAVRRLKRNNPNAIVVLTGCMPQAYPQQSIDLFSADIVLGNRNNDKLLNLLDEYSKNHERVVSIIEHQSGDKFDKLSISSFDERTRAFVKIQDGCNNFCSYCIIPTSRGRSRSKPLEDLRAEFKQLAEHGYKEVVLVGINLSCYGMDNGLSICDAVELACSFDSFKRVRLGSLEPNHITDEVIERLSGLNKFCPSFHISLQSGCDATLKRMNRHYTSEEYYELCQKLRSSFYETTITTDIMVGFALETDEDFEESIKFAKKVEFEKIHVFPYSMRKGTKAADITSQITKTVKSERCQKMIETGEEIRKTFFKSQIGKTVEVLCETHSDGFVYGYTKNYTPVKAAYANDLHGQFMNVKITGFDDEHCIGIFV
ncbi:MAG: tRNA (N(6)-L-threonylcarbamoyladenosine(37)-C(2))-methylthiotransferase MtaB [Clostridia bacterium]|nr:tRNA (N(6)-L-threonylcarbamoyladenosine(37)-C(2))-methylthiotransferase MtaB [Clostridia bacterium]